MRKLLSVLDGTKLSERLMMFFGVVVFCGLWSTIPSSGTMGLVGGAALFHAASLVYWVYRASALRQNLSNKNN